MSVIQRIPSNECSFSLSIHHIFTIQPEAVFGTFIVNKPVFQNYKSTFSAGKVGTILLFPAQIESSHMDQGFLYRTEFWQWKGVSFVAWFVLFLILCGTRIFLDYNKGVSYCVPMSMFYAWPESADKVFLCIQRGKSTQKCVSASLWNVS